jgi:catechol 2,3-dioxygenase
MAAVDSATRLDMTAKAVEAVGNVVRAGHIEFLVTDLVRSRAFYVDLLGFVETDADDTHVYLRGLEERHHHSLVLTQAETPGVAHLSYRVATDADLDALAAMAEAQGLPTRWMGAGEEAGQGRALRMQDPAGIPIEFYAAMAPAERMLQRFDLYRGAHIMRMDHFNIMTPDCQGVTDWYMRTLGFRCTEYTGTEDVPERLWAAWLHRKGSVHDLAVMNGTGPRVHHGAWSLPDAMAVLRCCDVLAGAGMGDAIERGPGRHGIANALFLYLRDPDGNRVELYACDYLTVDPDFAPIRWTLNDPRRQTLWGHYVPRRWFEEAMHVQSITDGTFVPTHEPQLTSTPTYVH